MIIENALKDDDSRMGFQIWYMTFELKDVC